MYAAAEQAAFQKEDLLSHAFERCTHAWNTRDEQIRVLEGQAQTMLLEARLAGGLCVSG